MRSDPYRLTCPKGHVNLRSRTTSGRYYCQTCEAHYERYHDQKTGAEVSA